MDFLKVEGFVLTKWSCRFPSPPPKKIKKMMLTIELRIVIVF